MLSRQLLGEHGVKPRAVNRAFACRLSQGLRLALLGLLALLGGGCSSGSQSLSVPISNFPGYEYFYLAEQKGLARSFGLQLRTLELMARREGLSPEAFAQAERGLRYFDLRDQLAILRPGGTMAVALRKVQKVQEALHLVRPGSPLPQVSDTAVAAALR